MDALVHRLQEKLAQDPSNAILQRTLSRLAAVQKGEVVDDEARDALRADFEALQRDGVMNASDISSLDVLRPSTPTHLAHDLRPSRPPGKINDSSTDQFRYVQANLADSTVPRLSISNDSPTLLPLELVDLLNQTYFLHVLATEPDQVLPPGKSLLSVLSRPNTASQRGPSSLESQVKSLVHTAFWDEVCLHHYKARQTH